MINNEVSRQEARENLIAAKTPTSETAKLRETRQVMTDFSRYNKDFYNRKQVSFKFFGAEDYGQGVSSFVDKSQSIDAATLYNAPTGAMYGDLSNDSIGKVMLEKMNPGSQVFINREILEQYGVVNPTTHKVVEYGKTVEGVGADVTYTDVQIHAKTLLATSSDGEQTLFIGTGNFTPGAVDQDPLGRDSVTNYLSRKGHNRFARASAATKNLFQEEIYEAGVVKSIASPLTGFEGKFQGNMAKRQLETMSQVNYGLVISDPQIISEYKTVLEGIKKGTAVQTDHFIVSGPDGKARQRYVELVNRAEKKISITSPFIEDQALRESLIDAVKSGKEVEIITLPVSSYFKKGAGGALQNRMDFISRMAYAGADIYTADDFSDVMLHAKAMTIDDEIGSMGSGNFTDKHLDGRSIEIDFVAGRNLAEKINEQTKLLKEEGIIKNIQEMPDLDNSVRLLRTQMAVHSLASQGMANKQYAALLADSSVSFTFSATAGASYHYGKSLHNTLMKQAGYNNLAYGIPAMGAAESLMEANAHYLQGSDGPGLSFFERAIARNFDIGFNTPGLGMMLNEKVFMPMGWGRVYKDEEGALPSLFGLAGKILDNGYMYYTQMAPDYMQLGQQYSQGLGYGQLDPQKEGIFEATFTNIATFSLASMQSLGLYMAVSQPIDMFKASLAKNNLERQINSIFRGSFIDEANGTLPGTKDVDTIAALAKERFNWDTLTETERVKIAQQLDNAIDTGGSAVAKTTIKDNVWSAVGRAIGSQSSLSKRYFFGHLVDQENAPGGIAAAILKQQYSIEQKNISFFAYDTNRETQRLRVQSMFGHQLAISRERGGRILDSVFRPFLEDFINPFEAGTDAFSKFNKDVDELIKYIRQPPDISITMNNDFEFKYFQYSNPAYSADTQVDLEKLGSQADSLKVGDKSLDVFRIQEDSTRKIVGGTVNSVKDLMEYTMTEQRALDKQLKGVLDEIDKLNLEKANGNLTTAREASIDNIVKGLKIQESRIKSLKARYDRQLADAAADMTVNISHMGAGYKTQIASKVQNILNTIPLNPLKWGMFGRRLHGATDSLMIGQLFSFQRSAEMIEDALTGNSALSRLMKSSEQIIIGEKTLLRDASKKISELESLTTLTDKQKEELEELRKTQAQIYGHSLEQNIKVAIDSAENFTANVLDRIGITNDPDRLRNMAKERELNKSIRNLSKRFRNVERQVVLGETVSGEAGSVEFRRFGETGRDITNSVVDDVGDRLILNIGQRENTSVMDDLIDAAVDYNKTMAGATDLTGSYMLRAVKQSNEANISGQIADMSKGFHKNMLAEAGLLSKHWAGTALVFSAIALDSFMQSTGAGASLFTQMGLMIGGKDYQISVEARGTKFLPVGELANQAFGWDPVITNTVVSAGTIGLSYFLGRKIALSQTTLGIVNYTLKRSDVAEQVAKGSSLFVLKASETGDKIFQRFDSLEEFVTEAKKMGTSTVYIGKRGVNSMTSATEGMRAIFMADESFKVDGFLREIATEVPSKTLVFSTIALLALGGARDVMANVLNAINDTPGGLGEGLALSGGLASAGLVVGSALQYYGTRAHNRLSKTIRSTLVNDGLEGAVLASELTRRLTMSPSARIATAMSKTSPIVGGAILGLVAMTGAIARIANSVDPEKLQGGSLDPLVGGLLGAAAGLALTKSPVGALIGATTLALSASALNWGGIKFLRTASRSQVMDAQSAHQVSQLGRFTSVVLDNEAKSSTFAMTVAAYASRAGENISLESELGDAGEDVRVIARQSPLPFLQFFVAERVKGYGKYGQKLGESVATENSQTTYSLGIQTGPLFGTSLALDLPIMYTPKKGFYGLTYNPDSNFEDLMGYTATVGAYSALFLGGAEFVSNNMARMFKFMTFGNEFMGKHLVDPVAEMGKFFGYGNKTVFSAAARINDLTLTTGARALTGLFSTDGILAFTRIGSDAAYTEDVIREALGSTLGEIQTLDASNNNSYLFKNDVQRARQKYVGDLAEWNNPRSKFDDALIKTGTVGKNFFMGFVLGASAMWAVGSVMRTWKMMTSSNSQEAIQMLQDEQEEITKQALPLMFVGVGAGALNATRKSFRIITDVGPDKSRYLTYDLAFRGSKAHKYGGTNRMANLIMDTAEGLGKLSKGFKNIVGGKVGAVAMVGALFAYNFMNISSEFGVAKFMDSHILYAEDGTPKLNAGETLYKANLVHQGLVAGTLSMIYGIPAMYIMRPLSSTKDTLLEFALRNNEQLFQEHAKGLMKAIDIVTPKFVKDFRRLGRDGEVLALVEQAQKWNGKFKGMTPEDVAKLNPKEAGIYNLLKELDPDDIDEFVNLHRLKTIEGYLGANARRAGQKNVVGGLAKSEAEKYLRVVNKIHEIANNGKPELLEAFNDLAGQTKLRRFGQRAMIVGAAVASIRMIGRHFFSLGGESGKDSYLDQIYEKAAGQGMMFSEGRDGKKTGVIQGLPMVFADAMRVFLGRDRIDLRLVQAMNKHQGISGEKLVDAPLVGNLRQYRQHMAGLRDLQQLLIVDKSNAYFGLFEFGGHTLRHGERGSYTTTYFQLQGAGHDISTAAYSMSAKFMFNQYLGGKGEAGRLMAGALAQFDRGQVGTQDAAVIIRNISAMTQSLQKNRQMKRIGAETETLLFGDTITSQISAARNAALEHMSWQPVESLFSNMFFETMDKAKQTLGRDAHRYLIEGIARSDRDALEFYTNFINAGAFGNVLASTSIKNMVFFSGAGGMRKSKGQKQNQDFANLWLHNSSLAAEAERFKQAKSSIAEDVQSKILIPLTTSGAVTFMPPPIKYAVQLTAIVGVTAFGINRLSRIAFAKTLQDKHEELSDFFGRTPNFKSVAHVQANAAATVRRSEMMQDLKDIRNSTKDWKTLRRSIADRDGIVSDMMHTAAANQKGRTLGKAYTITVWQGKKSVRFSLPDAVNNLGKAAGAAPEAQAEAFNLFANQVERYASSISSMNWVLHGNVVERVDDLLLRSVDKGSNLGAEALAKFNADKGTTFESVYDALKGATNVEVEHLVFNYKKFVQDYANDVLGKMVKNVIDVDMEGSLLTTLHQINGKEFYMFEILQGRVTEDGVLKGFGELGDELVDYNVTSASLDPKDPTGNLIHAKKEARLQVVRDIQKRELEWVSKTIQDVVEDSMADPQLRRLLIDGGLDSADSMGVRQTQVLMSKIMTAIQTHPRMEQFLKTYGGIFQPESLNRQQEVQGVIKSLIKQTAASAGDDATQAVLKEVLQYSSRTGRATAKEFLSHSLGIGFDIVGAVFDLSYGLDSYGAFARLGEAMTSPFATNADKALAKEELGHAVASSALGIGVSVAMFKLAPVIAGSAIPMLLNPVVLGGLFVAGAVVGGALALGGYKNVVKPLMHRAGVMMEESRILQVLQDKTEGFGKVFDRAIGNVAGAPVEGFAWLGEQLGNLGGKDAGARGRKMGALFGSHAMGFASGAAALTAIAFTIPYVSVSLIGASIAIGGAFLIGGALGMMFGQSMTDMSTKAIREISKIPILGQFLGPQMTSPYQAVRGKYARKFAMSMKDSPFSIGYQGDIVNQNWMQIVDATDDYTGRDMVRALFGNVLDNSTENISPAWREFASSSMIGSPPGLTDQIQDRELRLRAQAYGDTVIGNYQWNEMVKIADNGNEIRNADEAIKAYRLKQISQRRLELAQAMVKASADVTQSPTAAVNTVNATAELNKAHKRAKELANNEGRVLTKVGVETSSDRVTDAVAEQNSEAYQLAIGSNVENPQASVKYSARLFYDDAAKKTYVDIEKETASDNEIVLAIKAGAGVTETAPDVKIQKMTQELHAHPSMMPRA